MFSAIQRLAIQNNQDQPSTFITNQAKCYDLNNKYADCIFVVGSSKTEILGIRVLFATQSEYFDALLFNTFFNSQPINYNNNNNNNNTYNKNKFKPTFYESDVSIETFDFIMKYCYGIHDQLYITFHNVFQIYYASQKYLINPLIVKCEQYIDLIIESNSTSINDIIEIYCQSIECGCPTFADKIEEKLKIVLKQKDNTKSMLAFMDFFNKLLSNCNHNNIKMIVSNRDQHIFNILLHSLLTANGMKLNQENVETILISCKNYILNLPYQLFLKWFVENELFNVNRQQMHDLCVEYCKHFMTRVKKSHANTNIVTESARINSDICLSKYKCDYNYNHTHNNYNDDSTIAINNDHTITNYRVLSLDGDDEVNPTEIEVEGGNNDYNYNCNYNSDYDIDDLTTFGFDLSFRCWEKMLEKLFTPSIENRYCDNPKSEELKEKDVANINEECSERICEIANCIENGDAQTRWASIYQLTMLVQTKKLGIDRVMQTPNLVKKMIELLNPNYNHNIIVKDFANKEKAEEFITELSSEILWCITYLVRGPSHVCQQIVKMGAIQTIMIVLNNTKDNRVKGRCVWVLGDIADDNTEYKHFMLYHKLMQYLVSHWNSFNVDIKEKTVRLMSILCCWSKNKETSKIESRYWQDKKICIKLVNIIFEKEIYGYGWIPISMMVNCLRIIESFVNDSPPSVLDDAIECVCNERRLIDNITALLKCQTRIYDRSIIQLAKQYNTNVDECKIGVGVCHFEQNLNSMHMNPITTTTNTTNTTMSENHKITLVRLKSWHEMNYKYIHPLFRIFGALLSHNDIETQMVLNSGFINLIMPFIHSPLVRVRRQSLWLLSNILVGTTQQIEQIVANPALVKTIISKCLNEESNSVCFEALWCIYNLLRSGNKDQILKFKNAGCILCLVKFLHCSKEKEISLALSGLESLLFTYNQISDQNQKKEIIDELEKSEGLERLKQLQTIENVSDEICQKSKDLVKIIQFWSNNDQ